MSGLGGGGVPCHIADCKSVVYDAERMTVKMNKVPVYYHPKCFICEICGKRIASSDKAVAKKKDEWDDYKLMCLNCDRKEFAGYTTKVKWEKKTDVKEKKTSSSRFGGGGTLCPICNKTVYPAEKLVYEKKAYHPKCFVCSQCPKKLSPSTAEIFQGILYCKTHYKRLEIARKKANTSWTPGKKSAGGSGKYGGGGTPCSVCGKNVYAGERVSYDKRIFHPGCLSCDDCGKKLSVAGTKILKADVQKKLHDMALWKAAKAKLEGKTEATSTTTEGKETTATTTDVKDATATTTTTTSTTTPVFSAIIACDKCWTSNGYKQKQTLVSKYHFQRREAIKLGIIKPSASETKKTSSSSSKRFGGGGKKCAACGKTVYPNEEVSYEKKAYHAKCLICSVKDCGKKIKQANLASFQGQLICPQCWTRGGYAHKQAKATGEKKKNEAKVDSRFKKFGGTSIQCDKKACTQKEKLYPTSAIVFEKKSFHKACFTCEHPTNHPTPRKLEISRTNYKRHKEDGTISIYCDTCFKALGLHRAELN